MSEQDLQAITGLSPQRAAQLLEAANGDINTAVHLHFAQVDANANANADVEGGGGGETQVRPTAAPSRQRLPSGSATADEAAVVEGRRSRVSHAPPPTVLAAQSTRGWERFLSQLCRMLGSFTSHTVNELLSFIKGIFVPHAPVTDVSFTTRFHALLPADHPARSLVLVEPPIGNALTQAVNLGVPLVVIGVDFRAISQARYSDLLTHILDLLRAPVVLAALQNSVVCYGHNMESSMWASLTSRALGLQSPFSMTILLPLRLSPSVAEQYRLILRGRNAPVQLRRTDNFPGINSSETAVRWSADIQERLVEALQAGYASLAAEAPPNCTVGIELLRGSLLSCCKIAITADSTAASTAGAIELSKRLAEPIQQKLREIELRRQEDRLLRERQQAEYEESLRADRQRAKEKAERERAEAEVAQAQAEAERAARSIAERRANEAKDLARRILQAEPAYPEAAESDFADISLRIAPSNERIRVRVHRALPIAKLQQTLCVLDALLEEQPGNALIIDGTLNTDLPSSVRGLGTDEPKKIYQGPLVPIDGEFQLISMGAGPLHGDKTVEESNLLPNAVVHLRPTCA